MTTLEKSDFFSFNPYNLQQERTHPDCILTERKRKNSQRIREYATLTHSYFAR